MAIFGAVVQQERALSAGVLIALFSYFSSPQK